MMDLAFFGLVFVLALLACGACTAVAYTYGIMRGYRWGREVPEPGEFEIKKSPIHGLGVFATKRYEPGEYIGLYEGRIDCNSDSIYFQPLGEYEDEDEDGEWGVEGDGPLKYMNSAQDPNAEIDDVFVHALKVIEPGDEITLDYWYAEEEEEEGTTVKAGKDGRIEVAGTLEEVQEQLAKGPPRPWGQRGAR